jgi:tripartite-type tricarboxylate transporter receptor subunit TctC
MTTARPPRFPRTPEAGEHLGRAQVVQRLDDLPFVRTDRQKLHVAQRFDPDAARGKLRALAVTTAKRVDALPDIPTVGEFVPGYEAFGWYGLGVPRNTPTEIVNKLSEAMNAALADPKARARLVDLGVEPTPKTAAEFGKFIGDETEKWAKVIKSAGIKPD